MQQVEILRERLRDAGGVLYPDAGHDKPDEGERHRYSVIAVGAYEARLHGAGCYRQTVGALLDPDAEARELVGDSGDTVGLLVAGVGYVRDRGRSICSEGGD